MRVIQANETAEDNMSTSGLPFPYPFFPIPFTKTGEVFQPSAVDALLAGLAATGARPTDLFLISHGWNNNTQDAESLYRGLSGQLAAQIPKIDAGRPLVRRLRDSMAVQEVRR